LTEYAVGDTNWVMTDIPQNADWKRRPLSYEDLFKVYQELDDNSKILVQTDLELHKAKGEVETRINQLLLLNKLSDLIHASQDRQTILKTVCQSLVSGMEFDKAWVLYNDNETADPLMIQYGAGLTDSAQLLEIAERGLSLPQGSTDPVLWIATRRPRRGASCPSWSRSNALK